MYVRLSDIFGTSFYSVFFIADFLGFHKISRTLVLSSTLDISTPSMTLTTCLALCAAQTVPTHVAVTLDNRCICAKGSSIKWTKVLEDLTDGRSNQLDPIPMLEYFKPLHMWLLKQNLNVTEWDCDKYLDLKQNRVRAYDEELVDTDDDIYIDNNLANSDKKLIFKFKIWFIFCALSLKLLF